jgi:DNA-binding response OmpR family regulator
MLPRLSGRDVGQELRAGALTRQIPIIVVTSTDPGDIEGISVDCILIKPVLPERLVEAVDRCVRNASAV